jgi:predicted aspartyl protease
MGRFSVTVDLANNRDLVRAEEGDISPGRVRRVSIRGVVDTGAARLVLPQSVVAQLGLPTPGKVGVRYADGRRCERPLATDVHLTYAGRGSVFDAVVEPDRDSALIGAIVLEALDLLDDCTTQTLVPRDPERITSEIE